MDIIKISLFIVSYMYNQVQIMVMMMQIDSSKLDLVLNNWLPPWLQTPTPSIITVVFVILLLLWVLGYKSSLDLTELIK